MSCVLFFTSSSLRIVMGLLDHKRMAVLVAVALARLLQPAYVPPESCTYAQKKLGCVPNRIPMASSYGPFDLVPDRRG